MAPPTRAPKAPRFFSIIYESKNAPSRNIRANQGDLTIKCTSIRDQFCRKFPLSSHTCCRQQRDRKCSDLAMAGPYIVKTIPPLIISLASRGTAPDQNVKIPSSLKIRAAQEKLFLYSFLASIDCMLDLLDNQRRPCVMKKLVTVF